MTAIIDRPVISEIIDQHLENAAFCWARCHQDLWSPLATRRSLQRYQQRLQANLDGLVIAGRRALSPAITRLQRWKTSDEAFTAFFVLLQNLDHEDSKNALAICEQLAVKKQELTEGISAAWCTLTFVELSEPQRKLLALWWSSPEPALRCAALDLITKSPHISLINLVNSGLADPSPEFRARLLRLIGDHALYELLPRCEASLNDADFICRFEASYSMVLLGKQNALFALRDSLSLLKENDLKRALLLWATQSDDMQFLQWLESTSAENIQKQKMCLWAIGFRGDPTLLMHTLPWLSRNNSRLAAYIITHITDIDLENVLPEDSDEEPTDEKLESNDIGLTAICPNALKTWLVEYLVKPTKDRKQCRGKQLTDISAQTCLHEGTQPQRWQAALYLSHESSSKSGNTISRLIS
jgi:uncharacterized protein (TIGR02270 family)